MRVCRSIAAAILCVSILLVCSCRTLEPHREGVLTGYLPEPIRVDAVEVVPQTQWWLTFESAQLNRLMEEAFFGSLTLEQAAARLQQAEALARKAGATGKIQLEGKAAASSRYTSSQTGSHTDPTLSLGLYASYELDLWGRLQSQEKAALADWEASKFDLQTVAMSLSAELANNYFAWLAQNETLAIYTSQLESNRNKLTAMELRYRTGLSTSLDLLRQRQQVAAATAKLPPVRALINASENKIAVLIGKVPGTDFGLTPKPLPLLPVQPVTGLPVGLLENRPDIQAARLALESADWDVGAARAAQLPSISLTGNMTTGDDELEDLFDDWASNLAANLLAPLLDGGSRKAEVDRALAVSREKIAAYRLTLLEAIRETQDAFSNEKHQTDYVEAIGRQYNAAQKSESESMRRYQRGILPYLDTLTAIVARESLEITYIQAQAALLANRIQLYRSLGGDWTFILESQR